MPKSLLAALVAVLLLGGEAARATHSTRRKILATPANG